MDAHAACTKLGSDLSESHRKRGEHIRNCTAVIGEDIVQLRAAMEKTQGDRSTVRSDLKLKQGRVSSCPTSQLKINFISSAQNV